MDSVTGTIPTGLEVALEGARPEVCLDRPWQMPLSNHIKPDECPFENNKLGDGVEIFPNNWLAVNKKNRDGYHKLIMPGRCWPAKRLQELGGVKEIEKALSVANTLITRDAQEEIVLIFQVGWGGGQSLGHPHCHMRTFRRDKKRSLVPQFVSALWSSSLVLLNYFYGRVVLAGQSAGQCFILPNAHGPFSDYDGRKALSRTAAHVINLYNVKFKSTEGMSPDFSISFIVRNGVFEYGCYIPTLYHHGAYNKLAPFEDCLIELPWSHEVTYKHLTS